MEERNDKGIKKPTIPNLLEIVMSNMKDLPEELKKAYKDYKVHKDLSRLSKETLKLTAEKYYTIYKLRDLNKGMSPQQVFLQNQGNIAYLRDLVKELPNPNNLKFLEEQEKVLHEQAGVIVRFKVKDRRENEDTIYKEVFGEGKK